MWKWAQKNSVTFLALVLLLCAGALFPQNRKFSPTDFYASTTGSDSNDCLAATAGFAGHGPCLTVTRAVSQAVTVFDAMGQSTTVHVGTGTFVEDVAVGGDTVGHSNAAAFLTAGLSVPMLKIVGNGSGNTIIKNIGLVNGSGFCYAFLVHAGAKVGFQSISLEADGGGGGCGGDASDLFVERGGWAYIISDVKMLGATGPLIAMEDHAHLVVNPGDATRCNLTIAGSSSTGNGVNASDGSYFWSDSEICFANNPAFAGGYLFYGDNNTKYKLFGNPAVTSGAIITGGHFLLTANSSMHVYRPPATWPGTLGVLQDSSTYEGSDDGVTFSCTGLGAGGTCVDAGASSPHAGIVHMTTGTSPSSSGAVTIQGKLYGLTAGVCTLSPDSAGGTWALATLLQPGSFMIGGGITFNWSTTFSPSSNYYMNWLCRSSP